jgi:hypothetical protein
MPIPASERAKMLAVRLCGPRVIERLESIGITQLPDLADRDPYQLVHEINMAAGRPIWHRPIATQAMTNLIARAQREPNGEPAASAPPEVIATPPTYRQQTPQAPVAHETRALLSHRCDIDKPTGSAPERADIRSAPVA